MSWTNCLYETYDDAIKNPTDKPLIIAHSTQQAHVEVTVDKTGNFITGALVSKEDAETVIPVTEQSSSRTSGITPHPLCDKLKYIAKDYKHYCIGKNNKLDDNADYYEAYISQLKTWVDSQYSNEKVRAIYAYLLKGTLTKDLINCGVFSTDDNDHLTKKWLKTSIKMTAGDQQDAFIRFRVSGVDDITAVWQDSKLARDFIDFYLSQETEKGFCYLTGENARICVNNPAKIRNSSDKAKLISSNDNEGFTYRGRFKEADEAFEIGYVASQKIHSALKWLIQKQGVRVGSKYFVIWSVDNKEVPNPLLDKCNIAREKTNDIDTGEKVAEAFNNAIRGYRGNITNNSKIVLLGVDAATPGRLSVIFSREYYGQDGNELIDNIVSWHDTAAWNIPAWTEEQKRFYYFGAPSPYDIARFTFGTEQSGAMKCSDDKVLANTVERILPCICDGKQIPRDIVFAIINKSMHPQNYSASNWLRMMKYACALYRKYLYDYKKEEIELSVDKNSKDLSYNCGRLLAVADAIENYAKYTKKRNDDGEKNNSSKGNGTTNAMRYYTRFTQRPSETWLLINDKLSVYKQQLGGRGKWYYELLGEISENINIEEFRDVKLNGRFCLGFDSQRQDLIDSNIKKQIIRR